MKKYLFIFTIGLLCFTSCVKDENPTPDPIPPVPENYTDIVINELISKDVTDPYYIDLSGGAADWVELYNKGSKSVNIAGMWITDTESDETVWQQIPATDEAITTIPPKGFLVIVCGAADAEGNDLPAQILDSHILIDMGISSSKDSIIVLYDPEKTEVNRTANFGAEGPDGKLPDDISAGLKTNGGTAADWAILMTKTPGKSNDGSIVITGSLVINEFMCSNDATPVPGVDGDYPDYIEIYNTGDTPIDMGGWYCTDKLSEILQYQLPADQPELTTVPGHGFLILVCDGLGEGLHTNFKLSGSGEEIGISKDGTSYEQELAYGDGFDIPAAPTDNSTGLDSDGGAAWMIFDPTTSRPPTPGTSNNPTK
ncbi:MAG: lamin tail domain-containing protein [Bacteroidales bacterium]